MYLAGTLLEIGKEDNRKIIVVNSNPFTSYYGVSLANKFLPEPKTIYVNTIKKEKTYQYKHGFCSYLPKNHTLAEINKYKFAETANERTVSTTKLTLEMYGSEGNHKGTQTIFTKNIFYGLTKNNFIYLIKKDLIGKVINIERNWMVAESQVCDASSLKVVKPFTANFVGSNVIYTYFTDSLILNSGTYLTQINQKLEIKNPDVKELDFISTKVKFRYKILSYSEKDNIKLSQRTADALSNVATSAKELDWSITTLGEELNKIVSTVYSNRTIPNYNYDYNSITSSQSRYNNTLINEEKKEKKTMNFMKNFEFGKINTSAIKMSICGIAFKRSDNSFATYDAKTNTFTDVTDFLVDMDCVYVMPVAAKDIKNGDIVKHLNTYVVVKEVNEDGTISAISPIKAEEIIIIPTKNMFGFNYYSKVFNLFEGAFKPDAENPFGNPMALMMLFGENGGFNGDMKSMLPLLLLNNKDVNTSEILSNPLFFLALSK